MELGTVRERHIARMTHEEGGEESLSLLQSDPERSGLGDSKNSEWKPQHLCQFLILPSYSTYHTCTTFVCRELKLWTWPVTNIDYCTNPNKCTRPLGRDRFWRPTSAQASHLSVTVIKDFCINSYFERYLIEFCCLTSISAQINEKNGTRTVTSIQKWSAQNRLWCVTWSFGRVTTVRCPGTPLPFQWRLLYSRWCIASFCLLWPGAKRACRSIQLCPHSGEGVCT